MWILKSDRRSLVDLLFRKIMLPKAHTIGQLFMEPPKDNDFYLAWESEPQSKYILPSIIIVADGHLRDFLAWATTYIPSYKPFTAFFRVIEFSAQNDLKTDIPSLNGLEQACVGSIVSEASLLSMIYGKFTSLTLADCSGQLSYALSRALALGATPERIDRIKEKYIHARKISDYPYIYEIGQTTENIYHILFELMRKRQYEAVSSSKQYLFINACADVVDSGRISSVEWDHLTNGVKELKDAYDQMHGTIEERVLYFQDIVSKINISISDLRVKNFIVGYLASLIAPGSLSHIDLVMKHSATVATSVLWYGFFAGLHKKDDILNSHNILGRRLLRDLLRPELLFCSPTCDIALSELKILTETNDQSVQFNRLASNRVWVELEPFVSILLSWGKRKEGAQNSATPFLPMIAQKESVDLHKDLESHLQAALAIQRELAKRIRQNVTTGGSELSKSKRKKYKVSPKPEDRSTV